MSTLHLVEIDTEENIVDEVELDDEVLAQLNDADESTELSLAAEDNELYLVELDDEGNIVDAELLGDDEGEETELSLENRVEGLELSIATMLGRGVRAVGSAASKGFGAVKQSFKHGGAGDKLVRRAVGHKGRTAGIKIGRFVKNSAGATGAAIRNRPIASAAIGGAGAGAVAGGYLGRNAERRRNTALSLSAEELLTDKNPLLADAAARK